ncbi:MAG TPA: FtsX-like permease family protein [Pseudomonadales bacterium]
MSGGGYSGVAWWIALRYLRTRRRQFASFITRISVGGLSLGVLVLTVVVSVMNGFDAELKQRILGTVPHLVIRGADVGDPEVERVAGLPRVTAVYNFFTGAGMVTAGGAVNPVAIHGLDRSAVGAIATIEDGLRSGSLATLFEEPRGIVMGAPLAAHLGLLPGDSVALVISEPGPGGVTPQILRYRLVDVFEVGAELDYGLVLIPIDSLPGPPERLGQLGVRVTLDDPLAAAGVAERLAALEPGWQVTSWADSYGELFQAVRLEKLMMFLILLMVVAVASFNIVSGQSMAVNDKRADIAILRTMGAADRTVSRIFLLQGLLISVIGIAVGLAAGVVVAHHVGAVLAVIERWVGFRLLEGTYFVEIPSVVQPLDLVVIGAISVSLCLISAWVPARRAAALNPIAGLHG